MYEQLNRRGGAGREIAKQYLRAATSIGANYAEAMAGQTKPDFITRVAVARKECREVLFWLQLIETKKLIPGDVAKAELEEARQLAAILTAIVRKAKETSARG